jgi:hypothetical protein
MMHSLLAIDRQQKLKVIYELALLLTPPFNVVALSLGRSWLAA